MVHIIVLLRNLMLRILWLLLLLLLLRILKVIKVGQVVDEFLVSHVDVNVQLESLSRQIIQVLLIIIFPVLVSVIFLADKILLNIVDCDVCVTRGSLHGSQVEVLSILVDNLSLALVLHETIDLLLD
jgi:hypothetical protein